MLALTEASAVNQQIRCTLHFPLFFVTAATIIGYCVVAVSYTHLDVYKRQVERAKHLAALEYSVCSSKIMLFFIANVFFFHVVGINTPRKCPCVYSGTRGNNDMIM